MEEKALEVYKWILHSINGWSREDIDSYDFSRDYTVDQICEILEGKKYYQV